MREGLTKVGATRGLVQKGMDEKTPGQCIVWLDGNDAHREIRVERWLGYMIPQVMRITRNQAVELAELLNQAVTLSIRRQVEKADNPVVEVMVGGMARRGRFVDGEQVADDACICHVCRKAGSEEDDSLNTEKLTPQSQPTTTVGEL